MDTFVYLLFYSFNMASFTASSIKGLYVLNIVFLWIVFFNGY